MRSFTCSGAQRNDRIDEADREGCAAEAQKDHAPPDRAWRPWRPAGRDRPDRRIQMRGFQALSRGLPRCAVAAFENDEIQRRSPGFSSGSSKQTGHGHPQATLDLAARMSLTRQVEDRRAHATAILVRLTRDGLSQSRAGRSA